VVSLNIATYEKIAGVDLGHKHPKTTLRSELSGSQEPPPLGYEKDTFQEERKGKKTLCREGGAAIL